MAAKTAIRLGSALGRKVSKKTGLGRAIRAKAKAGTKKRKISRTAAYAGVAGGAVVGGAAVGRRRRKAAGKRRR